MVYQRVYIKIKFQEETKDHCLHNFNIKHWKIKEIISKEEEICTLVSAEITVELRYDEWMYIILSSRHPLSSFIFSAFAFLF
jgi:hypothetical protein